MSITGHKPREAAPRRQYHAAVVVPLVVFAFLAGAAAGYSLGRMGRDDCTDAFSAPNASNSATGDPSSAADGIAVMTRPTTAVRCLD